MLNSLANLPPGYLSTIGVIFAVFVGFCMVAWDIYVKIKTHISSNEHLAATCAEDMRTLYNISRAVGSTLDLELLIQRTVTHLQAVMKIDVYSLVLEDEDGGFSARASSGIGRRQFEIELGKGFFGETLAKKEISIAQDIYSDPRCQEKLYKNLGAKTLIAVPLHSKGTNLGLFLVGTRDAHKYAVERVTGLLAAVSDHLGVAVENVGIYEKEKEAAARVTELDRMKNEFISMISHELLTPLTSVNGYISLFLAGAAGPLTDSQKKYLEVIQENNQHLLTLLDRLLDFSRIESGRFSIKQDLISMHDVILSAVNSLQSRIKKAGAEISLGLAARSEHFIGDREKMQAVFVNLIENALKFRREGDRLQVRIETRDAGDFMRITVADNGIGIEKEFLEKVFNKFFQVDALLTRKANGMGLGLAVVKEIVGNHEGEIHAESEGRDRGAKFVLIIPPAEKG